MFEHFSNGHYTYTNNMNFHLITHVHEILQTIEAGLDPVSLSKN